MLNWIRRFLAPTRSSRSHSVSVCVFVILLNSQFNFHNSCSDVKAVFTAGSLLSVSCLLAVSQLSLSCLSAVSQLSLSCLSAVSQLSFSSLSHTYSYCWSTKYFVLLSQKVFRFLCGSLMRETDLCGNEPAHGGEQIIIIVIVQFN